jgi:hypothetical protein
MNVITLQSLELVEIGCLKLVKRSIMLDKMLTHNVMSESGIYELSYKIQINLTMQVKRMENYRRQKCILDCKPTWRRDIERPRKWWKHS